jgi:hypothetical protein
MNTKTAKGAAIGQCIKPARQTRPHKHVVTCHGMHQLPHVERIFIPYNVQVCKPQLVAMVAENLYETTMLAEIPPQHHHIGPAPVVAATL